MANIVYVNGGVELLDLVEPLWNKLNRHHEEKSESFKNKFRVLTFQTRKDKLINNKTLNVRIELVKDEEKDTYVGYCISTISNELVGEIDSLFIEDEYRKHGIGDKLINSAVEWLEINKVQTKVIAVAEGNESALDFYKRHGFYKRRTILEKI